MMCLDHIFPVEMAGRDMQQAACRQGATATGGCFRALSTVDSQPQCSQHMCMCAEIKAHCSHTCKVIQDEHG